MVQFQSGPTMNNSRLLHELLPYRMQAVDTLNVALRMQMKWQTSPSMRIFVEDKVAVEGNLNAFTNPAIEAGLLIARCPDWPLLVFCFFWPAEMLQLFTQPFTPARFLTPEN